VLFAHTSPVYVDYQGRRRFDLDAAEALLRQVEEAKAAITANGHFSSDKARVKLLALYDAAINDLKGRIDKRGRPQGTSRGAPISRDTVFRSCRR
jgi:hypothetical protein